MALPLTSNLHSLCSAFLSDVLSVMLATCITRRVLISSLAYALDEDMTTGTVNGYFLNHTPPRVHDASTQQNHVSRRRLPSFKGYNNIKLNAKQSSGQALRLQEV
jgi:hypothetical protein